MLDQMDNSNEVFSRGRNLAQNEQDNAYNLNAKINDNIILAASAVASIVIVSSRYHELKLAVYGFAASILFSLVALFLQKETHKITSFFTMIATMVGEKAQKEKRNLNEDELPDNGRIGKLASYTNHLTTLSFLSFLFGIVVLLILS